MGDLNECGVDLLREKVQRVKAKTFVHDFNPAPISLHSPLLVPSSHVDVSKDSVPWDEDGSEIKLEL